MFCTAHLRQPRLPGLPSSDAALCLPALGGDGHGARGTTSGVGETEPAAGLQNATGRRAAGRSLDDAVVNRFEQEEKQCKRSNISCAASSRTRTAPPPSNTRSLHRASPAQLPASSAISAAT